MKTHQQDWDKIKLLVMNRIYDEAKGRDYIVERQISNDLDLDLDLKIKSNEVNIPVEIKYLNRIAGDEIEKTLKKIRKRMIKLLFFVQKRKNRYDIDWRLMFNGNLYDAGSVNINDIIHNNVFTSDIKGTGKTATSKKTSTIGA